jgi:hypothetical protein
MARHLFVAVTPFAFGEAVVGARIAADLCAQGEEVVFLAPRALRTIFAGHPAKVGWLDDVNAVLAEAIVGVARERRCDAICLVDVAAVATTLAGLKRSLQPLFDAPMPVIALDLWGLGDTDLVFDYEQETFRIDRRVMSWPRFTAVPIARPDSPGAFSIFATMAPPDVVGRDAARARLGVRPEQRVVVWPTARWQITRDQPIAVRRQMLDATKALAVRTLDALGPDLLLVHVGPEPMAQAAALGRRYRFLPQLAVTRFADVVQGADLYFGLNATATSAITALGLGIPAVIGVHTAPLPAALSPAARAAVAAYEPYPYLMWTLGLRRFLGKIFAGNPYLEALRLVELFDTEATTATLQALLRDPAAASAERGRIARYREAISALPSGAERYRALAR